MLTFSEGGVDGKDKMSGNSKWGCDSLQGLRGAVLLFFLTAALLTSLKAKPPKESILERSVKIKPDATVIAPETTQKSKSKAC